MAEALTKIGMKPSHPGEFIRTEVLEPLGLDVAKAARILDVRRVRNSAMGPIKIL